MTVAAANITLDLTLVKYEAPKEYQPKEYQPLGRNLPKKHKDNAETGMIYVTARRLGALFEVVCPLTPRLVEAYGLRVSEILEALKGMDEAKNTIFADYAGIDGAAIWTAATSSTTAIHVQILACMLAQTNGGAEAISVLVELVKERKEAIASAFKRGEEMPNLSVTAALQTDMPRFDSAEWDASARAWLRAADSVRAVEQRQLMTFLDKVDISVSRNLEVYASIVSAWKSALRSMERLIRDMPQAVDTGPILLALESWYLYPDVVVLGSRTAELRFKDPLVSNG
jgi:hypothetical protein